MNSPSRASGEQGNTSEKTETSKRDGKRPASDSEDSSHKRSRDEEPSPRIRAYTATEVASIKQLANTKFMPTRFLDSIPLGHMGIGYEVDKILRMMGLNTFALIRDYLYPDLAKEFFATVNLRYFGDSRYSPSSGKLTFKIDGKAYAITISELCNIYNFENKDQPEFEEFAEMDDFWDLIAQGRATGNMKTSLIRYPPLRIVAKFLANTFHIGNDSATTNAEYALLFSGVRRVLLGDDGLRFSYLKDNQVNLGCLFAKSLINVRSSMAPEGSVCYLGSMITRILRYVNIPLNDCVYDKNLSSMNRDYLMHSGILEKVPAGDYSYVYRYVDKSGTSYSLRLPCRILTKLTNENLRFEHFDERLVSRRRLPPPPQFNSSTWELPRLSGSSVGPSRGFVEKTYMIQDRVNRLAKKQTSFLMEQINQLKKEVQRLSGSTSNALNVQKLPEWTSYNEECYTREMANVEHSAENEAAMGESESSSPS